MPRVCHMPLLSSAQCHRGPQGPGGPHYAALQFSLSPSRVHVQPFGAVPQPIEENYFFISKRFPSWISEKPKQLKRMVVVWLPESLPESTLV
ncbi:hypothetical protein NQZ68_008094 [Dissostichus eleginoides]|nr:hypothetical protein NQZ68_008094 [Dissostichus eleginoides]